MLNKGDKLTNGKNTFVVARIGEDKEGYPEYWLELIGGFGVRIGPYSQEKIEENGYRRVEG